MVSRGEKDRRSRRQARASVAIALASLIVAPAPEIAGPPLRQLGETVNDAGLPVAGGSRLDAEPVLSKAGRFLDPRLHPSLGFGGEYSLAETLVAGADLALGHAKSLGSAGLSGSKRLERAGEGDDGAGLDRAVL